MRRLHQDTGTITSVWFATARTPVLHIFEHGQCFFDHMMQLEPIEVGIQTYPARVSLKLWKVKSFLTAFCIKNYLCECINIVMNKELFQQR